MAHGTDDRVPQSAPGGHPRRRDYSEDSATVTDTTGGSRMPHPFTLVNVLAAVLAASPAVASEAISQKAGCAVCHAVDKKGIGPSYREIAAKYRGNAKAAAVLAERVRHGSKGVWGQVPMPPTPTSRLSDAELTAVIDWLLKT
jgi:cytochrome c